MHRAPSPTPGQDGTRAQLAACKVGCTPAHLSMPTSLGLIICCWQSDPQHGRHSSRQAPPGNPKPQSDPSEAPTVIPRLPESVGVEPAKQANVCDKLDGHTIARCDTVADLGAVAGPRQRWPRCQRAAAVYAPAHFRRGCQRAQRSRDAAAANPHRARGTVLTSCFVTVHADVHSAERLTRLTDATAL